MNSDVEAALRAWLTACWPGVNVIYSPQPSNAVRPPRPYATVRVNLADSVGHVEIEGRDIPGNPNAMLQDLRLFTEGEASVQLFSDSPAGAIDDLRVSLYGGRGREALDASGLVIRTIGAEQDLPDTDGTTWLRRRAVTVYWGFTGHRQTEPVQAARDAEGEFRNE